jgi:hypothetical protein
VSEESPAGLFRADPKHGGQKTLSCAPKLTKSHQLEANPTSKNRWGVVEEELAAAGADQDAEVLQQAQVLLEAIQRQAPEVTAVIGVDLKDIEGASLAIRRVIATGTGVKVERGTFRGDVTIEDVRAGGSGGRLPNA